MKIIYKIFTSLLVVGLILPSLLIAGSKNKTYGNAIVTEVTSIYDGDTFRANIKDYPPIVGERMGIRVYGIDTPEMRDKRARVKKLAQQAKQFAVKRLREGKEIILKNIRRGKYFRIVAEVWIDGVSLGDELIKAGLAKPYFGGKKSKW